MASRSSAYLLHAVPAEVELTVGAVHVTAAVVLLDHRLAVGTRPRDQHHATDVDRVVASALELAPLGHHVARGWSMVCSKTSKAARQSKSQVSSVQIRDGHEHDIIDSAVPEAIATLAFDCLVAFSRDLLEQQRSIASCCGAPDTSRMALDKVLEQRLLEPLLAVLVVLSQGTASLVQS